MSHFTLKDDKVDLQCQTLISCQKAKYRLISDITAFSRLPGVRTYSRSYRSALQEISVNPCLTTV